MAKAKSSSKKAAAEKILLIVESPAKAKTIEKYLGAKYSVLASMGHLIDLPKSRMAINVESGFEPEYITVRGKASILKELVKTAIKSSKVLLASDNDREGEAIAWHLKEALKRKKPDLDITRIVFNEITPAAIREAIEHPRPIDEKKVEAQKARRVLDRLVGYNLSPLLWKKVKNGLSAGRVQSVALKLICDREKEVEAFIPQEYWTIEAQMSKGKSEFTSQLVQYKNEKAEISSKEQADAILKPLEGQSLVVAEVKETEKSIKPKAPFTTSKLQQSAANRLGFTSRKTMQIAQQLYEGINIGSSRIGLITYMRTDSTRISTVALDEARKFIGENYPQGLPAEAQIYAASSKAQDAHEAIRPTMVAYTPESIKEHLTGEQFKVYSIIWERFVSSQMTVCKTVTTSVDFTGGDCVFRLSGTTIVDPGFYKALKLLKPKEKTLKLPSFKIGESCNVSEYLKEQHFTSGPARYTDASIVKTLEEKGIGRPSTYAPIISLLLDRYYVVRKNRQLAPTTLGRIINDMLMTSFPDILNVNFTAGMENKLDEVEDLKVEWRDVVGEFYSPFKKNVDHVMETLESIKGVLDEPTDEVCEKCGKPMVKKLGRFGFFLACTGFPDCKNTKAVPLADCPKEGCNGKIVARKKTGGRGKEFYGCTNYPECDFISYYKPTAQKCPKCGEMLVEKYDKKNGTYKACMNPECDFQHMGEAPFVIEEESDE